MLPSRLRAPDFPSEHWEHAHSPSVARALRRALPLLRRDEPQAAYTKLARLRSSPMALGQRYRVLFVEALAVRRAGQPALAALLLEEVRDLALRLGTIEDFALIDAELTKSLYFAQQPEAAANAAQRGLDTLASSPSHFSLSKVSLTVELQHRLGECRLNLGQLESARRDLYAVFRLTRASVMDSALALKTGVIAWDLAFLHQVAGDLELAHSLAMEALPLVTTYGEPDVRARMHIALANILLDQAAPFGAPHAESGRGFLLDKAQMNIAEARALLVGSADRAARNITDLAHTRMSRLIGLAYDRLGTLRRIEYIAQEHDEHVVLAKTCVALALELLANGETECAVECLRYALHIFASHPAAEQVTTFKLLRVSEESLVS